MKEKFILFSSIFLLIASVAIIFWINQEEKIRLALYDRLAIQDITELPTSTVLETPEQYLATDGDVEQTFSRIDVLLSSIGSDDLPLED